MGRRIRKVKAGWEHPKQENGRYRPLLGASYSEAAAEWDEGLAAWLADPADAVRYECRHDVYGYADANDRRPCPSDYMPEWPEGEATKLVLYEDTSEGTPLSPQFDTLEEVAAWAAENTTTFGSFKATESEWLDMLRQDFVAHRAGNLLFI